MSFINNDCANKYKHGKVVNWAALSGSLGWCWCLRRSEKCWGGSASSYTSGRLRGLERRYCSPAPSSLARQLCTYYWACLVIIIHRG